MSGSQPILDPVAFGLELRLLRMRRGYARPQGLADVMKQQHGIEVSERTMWAIERGEQMPTLDLLLALLVSLRVGLDHFYPTFNRQVVEALASPS